MKIRSAKVEGGVRTEFDVMLEHYETHDVPGGPRDPAVVRGHEKILNDTGVGRHDTVLWDFDIILEVEPVTPATPPGPGGPTTS